MDTLRKKYQWMTLFAFLITLLLASILAAQEPVQSVPASPVSAAAPLPEKSVTGSAVPPASAPAVQTPPVKTPLELQLEETQKNIDRLNVRLDEWRVKIFQCEKQIVKQSEKIKELLKLYASSDATLAGFSGLGRVEQLELKSELYASERMARKKLCVEFDELTNIIDEYAKAKRGLAEDQKMKDFADQFMALRGASSSSSGISAGVGDPLFSGEPGVTNVEPESPEAVQARKIKDIEYYQVKTPADLKTISAYPDVYGAPEYWVELYQANKDQILDPEKIIPAGTRLVVPQNIKDRPEFKDL